MHDNNIYIADRYSLMILHQTNIEFICGDAGGDGALNILDVAYIINYLYRGGPAPYPIESADMDSSGGINILDITRLINYLYKGGPAPACPDYY